MNDWSSVVSDPHLNEHFHFQSFRMRLWSMQASPPPFFLSVPFSLAPLLLCQPLSLSLSLSLPPPPPLALSRVSRTCVCDRARRPQRKNAVVKHVGLCVRNSSPTVLTRLEHTGLPPPPTHHDRQCHHHHHARESLERRQAVCVRWVCARPLVFPTPPPLSRNPRPLSGPS